jgi:hypothetical protein
MFILNYPVVQTNRNDLIAPLIATIIWLAAMLALGGFKKKKTQNSET